MVGHNLHLLSCSKIRKELAPMIASLGIKARLVEYKLLSTHMHTTMMAKILFWANLSHQKRSKVAVFTLSN